MGGGEKVGRYGWTEVFLDVYYYQGGVEDGVGHCGCSCSCGLR